MKMRRVGVDLFHGDGQTDERTDRHVTNLIVAFRNFTNVPENEVTRTINTPLCGYSQCMSNAEQDRRHSVRFGHWRLDRGGNGGSAMASIQFPLLSHGHCQQKSWLCGWSSV